MKKLIASWWSNKSNVKLILAPVLLIICNLFLFGPATIYSGNISEFNISLIDILKYYAVPGMIMLLIFLGIGIALSKKYLSLYVALIFAVGVLLWLQGNILVWDYGVFGKGDIDWTKNSWRGWVDGSLWVLFLSLSCIFYKQASKVAALAATVLISLQIIMLIYTGIEKPEIWKKKHQLPIAPPSEIFEFSSKQNVIHIILDELQSTIFQEIIDEDPDYYYAALEGFTFFKETTGSFPTTYMSVPAILSGKVYKNDVPIDRFIKTVFEGQTICDVLYESGYDIDLAALMGYQLKDRYSNFYSVSVPYGVTEDEYVQANATLIFSLVLFRSLPHVAKRAVLNTKEWLPIININKNDPTQFSGSRIFSHEAFLQDLIDRSSVRRNKPIYKFIHLVTTHYPAVLDDKCEYAGQILPWTWQNIKVQAKCGFDHFLEFIAKLKSLGIYDKSLIILQADHGYWKIPDSAKQILLRNMDKKMQGAFADYEEYFAQVVCSSLPLLAVKRPYDVGPLRISEAQVMLTDIPATISSILNLDAPFTGQSVFEIEPKETRVREFHYYEKLNSVGDQYFDRIDEYFIEGSVFDRASWQLGPTYLSPNQSFNAREINFGSSAAHRFLRFGWSYDGKDSKEGLTFNWALGNSASLLLSLPKDEVVVLLSNVKAPKFVRPQRVTIEVDGKEIGVWEIGSAWKWEKHSIVVEPDPVRPNVSVVEFVFSEHYEPDERITRPLAVLFESLRLEKPSLER